MVIRIELRIFETESIIDGMTIEYQNCRADLSFKVEFRVNGAIDTIVTKWDLILFRR